MNVMTRRTASLLVFLLLPMTRTVSSSSAGDAITVTLRSDSLSENILQVRDDACRVPKEIECSDARIALQSQACLNNPAALSCKQAREAFDSACGCIQARAALEGADCRQQPASSECVDARVKVDSAGCQEGLIYEGSVPSNAQIPLTICTSPGGYGAVSIRDIKKGPVWKSYRLISRDDLLRYP